MQPEDIRKKNISEGGLLIIFTQHAKGLSTGAEKKSIPTVTSDVKYMIKGTGLPAWSVFIAAVDFFHNKKNLISDIFFIKSTDQSLFHICPESTSHFPAAYFR